MESEVVFNNFFFPPFPLIVYRKLAIEFTFFVY
nr:MAG TPA: hypothetical protein [Caudoviricetes sp.]